MILRTVIGIVAGGLIGFGWYRLVGCASGACPITSNPWISTMFGMAIGAMLAIGR